VRLGGGGRASLSPFDASAAALLPPLRRLRHRGPAAGGGPRDVRWGARLRPAPSAKVRSTMGEYASDRDPSGHALPSLSCCPPAAPRCRSPSRAPPRGVASASRPQPSTRPQRWARCWAWRCGDPRQTAPACPCPSAAALATGTVDASQPSSALRRGRSRRLLALPDPRGARVALHERSLHRRSRQLDRPCAAAAAARGGAPVLSPTHVGQLWLQRPLQGVAVARHQRRRAHQTPAPPALCPPLLRSSCSGPPRVRRGTPQPARRGGAADVGRRPPGWRRARDRGSPALPGLRAKRQCPWTQMAPQTVSFIHPPRPPVVPAGAAGPLLPLLVRCHGRGGGRLWGPAGGGAWGRWCRCWLRSQRWRLRCARELRAAAPPRSVACMPSSSLHQRLVAPSPRVRSTH